MTAEGIETKQQLEVLRETQCDSAQGFLLSKPVTADEFEALLKEKITLRGLIDIPLPVNRLGMSVLSFFEELFQKFTRIRLLIFRDFFRCAFGNNVSALTSTFWAEINDPISGFNNV